MILKLRHWNFISELSNGGVFYGQSITLYLCKEKLLFEQRELEVVQFADGAVLGSGMEDEEERMLALYAF